MGHTKTDHQYIPRHTAGASSLMRIESPDTARELSLALSNVAPHVHGVAVDLSVRELGRELLLQLRGLVG